ncbi:MAG: hypothetical protein ACJ77K_07885 [Bacteroidia bacterium]
MLKLKEVSILFLSTAALMSSCSSPRSVLNSGKVLPKGQVRFGKNTTINIASAPIERSVKGSYNFAQTLSGKDTILYTQQVEDLNAAFMAYCLDPIGYNTETFFRYGIGKRMDFGFRNTGGANAADFMYQFLGSNKTCNESNEGGMYGSIGVQYSWQNFRFVNVHKFEQIQKLFGFELSRKDISIPVIFSKSFGPEERVGCLSFGVVYTHSFIHYKINPKHIYEQKAFENVPAELMEPVSGNAHFGAYGTFINLKIGKKFVFFNVSLAAYYQNYGKFDMLGGNSVSLKGVSIVPSYGLQFNILPKKKKIAGDF